MWMPRPPEVLGKPRDLELREQSPRLRGDLDRVVEVGPRLRVEVEPKLVGVIDVGPPHRPGMEGERPHLGAPRDDAELGRADLVGVAAGRELDAGGLDPVGSALGDSLLVEGVALVALPGGDGHPLVDPLGPALQGGRALAERTHDPVADGDVVLGDLELRDVAGLLRGREDDPVCARDTHFAAVRLDHRVFLRHRS